jgi:hypothetical protein
MNKRMTGLYRPLPEDGAPDGAQPNGGGGGALDAKATPKTPAPGPEKMHTQADVDRIVAERVAREQKKFADYADVKAKASKLDQLEAANATELERAVKAARDEVNAEWAQKANTRLVAAEARALAASNRFRDASDAVRFIDLTGVPVSDDGAVDTDAIAKQLAQLAKDKPYLIVEDTPPVPTPNRVGVGVAGSAGDENVTPGLGRLRQAYSTK